jgi:uncharacterized Zn finger protein (UPF0148 family)
MEPEIARRCHDCGASVRSGSLFCPQCGKALQRGTASASGQSAESPENLSRRVADSVRSASLLEPRETASAPLAPVQENVAHVAGSESQRHADIQEQRASSPDDDGGVTSKRQRVTAAARDVVDEKLSPRVEKLRHASNVMLEEAAYDPSLRFVLVAVILLLLSLFLLLLNYLLG